ncbi:MAG: GNAT family N-acetyltransferase [Actinomycetota bacterium]|nr:GNAT family N-acetyltransferase [Actinomycetota bacterium]
MSLPPLPETNGPLAARDHAFDTLRLPELISVIHPENVRSQRLARRLGMTLSQNVHNPVLDRYVEVWQLTSPHLTSPHS